jgi:hypothetical protein
MSKTLLTLTILVIGLSVGVTPSRAAASEPSAEPVNPVLQWNRALLVIVRTPGAQPTTVHSTRSFAIMHAAIYDAVNSIDRSHRRYLVQVAGASRHASQEAAAASAAHDVLVELYPGFQAFLDDQFEQSLKPIPDGPAKTEGIRIGRTVSHQILALRSHDRSDADPIPYIFGTEPGDYQSTPPNFPPQPQFTHWSFVTPFTLRRANQFRPGAPPVLAGHAYAEAFNEVKSLGTGNSTIGEGGTALIGRFWNGPIQNYWNEITQTAASAHQLTTAASARLFALLDLAIADGVIAFYDAKYTYNFWRPVTGIRLADPNINPDTLPDPNWLPLVVNTAPDPSYPGAHAVISAAGADVLTFFFERDDFDFIVTSEVLPGVERSFTTFSAAGDEAAVSRIFAGQHFRFDETAGQRLGFRVADWVLDNFLVPRHRGNESADDS